jgi:hypothetical protein
VRPVVVSVSGGLSSIEALERSLATYGRDTVYAVFADVGTVIENGRVVCGEDEDLIRFMGEAEEYLGVSINRISHHKYKNIWDCFFGEKFMGNTRIDTCSKFLKRETLGRWISAFENPIRIIGFSWMEKSRSDRYLKYFPDAEFPLCLPPYLTNEDIARKWESRGIRRSRSYSDGFSHDNCGGMCVKMGIGQAWTLWKLRPWRYEYAERREKEFRKTVSMKATIFRKSGEPITMEALRLEFEAGYIPKSVDSETCGGRCILPEGEEQMELFA